MIKTKFNRRYINFIIVIKIVIFIFNKYENRYFRESVIIKRIAIDDKSRFYKIYYINITYFSLQFFFK